MSAYLEPGIDQGADNLYGQSPGDDAENKTGHTEIVEHIKQNGIRGYREKIGNDSPVAVTQLMAGPPVYLTVSMDRDIRDKHRKGVNHNDDTGIIDPRHIPQITEESKDDQSRHRKIERRKQKGDEMRTQNKETVVHDFGGTCIDGFPVSVSTQTGDGYAHLFAVLRHSTPGHRIAFLLERFGDGVIGKGMMKVFTVHNFTDDAPHFP